MHKSTITEPLTRVPIKGYINRIDSIVKLCRGKKVLDLGVVGETCADFDRRVASFPSSLHLRLAEEASYLVGVDHSAEEIESLKACYKLNLYTADIEELSTAVGSESPFDVVVMGNVIEHLSNPGKALAEISRLLVNKGQIIVTCPNAFGAPNYLRFLIGRYYESQDHTQSYTKYTLANLLQRHGFYPVAAWTALDRTPRSFIRKAVYRLGSYVLRCFPELGGTLLMVGELEDTSVQRRV